MDENTAIKILQEVKFILDEGRVKYWLDQGTLLGAIRDGKFIAWDGDIDLGTTSSEFEKVVHQIPLFIDKGFRVGLSSDFHIGVEKNSVPVNITLYRVKSDKAWVPWYNDKSKIASQCRRIAYFSYYKELKHSPLLKVKIAKWLIPKLGETLIRKIAWVGWKLCGGHYILRVIPKHYFENLDRITFYNTEFNIPSLVENYLSYQYGDNWLQPNPDWNSIVDDGTPDNSFRIDKWEPLRYE